MSGFWLGLSAEDTRWKRSCDCAHETGLEEVISDFSSEHGIVVTVRVSGGVDVHYTAAHVEAGFLDILHSIM